jgi:hypothetical protein
MSVIKKLYTVYSMLMNGDIFLSCTRGQSHSGAKKMAASCGHRRPPYPDCDTIRNQQTSEAIGKLLSYGNDPVS